jgi:hypothetical protein
MTFQDETFSQCERWERENIEKKRGVGGNLSERCKTITVNAENNVYMLS